MLKNLYWAIDKVINFRKIGYWGGQVYSRHSAEIKAWANEPFVSSGYEWSTKKTQAMVF